MTKVQNIFKIGESNEWLIETLAQELYNPHIWNLQDILVVFPTKRLAHYLLARLSFMYKKAFVPPKIHTLESFLQTWKAQIEDLELMKVLQDEELLIILFYLIQQNKFLYIQHGLEKDLLFLFMQININFNVDDDTFFDKLKHAVIDNLHYHNETYINTLINKFEEIRILYTQFINHLEKNNLLTYQQYLLRCAQIISTHSSNNIYLYGCKKAYFVGFTDIQDFLMPFFTFLSNKKNVYFWFNSYLKLFFTQKNTLEDIANEIFKLNKQNLKLEHVPDKLNNIQIYSYQTTLQEVIHTANKIQILIKNGIPPSAIGVVILNEEEYLTHLLSMLDNLQIQTNISMPIQIQYTPIGNWIWSFVEFVGNVDTTQKLISWITHPITLAYLKQNIPELIEIDLYQIKSYLIDEIVKTQAGYGIEDIITKTQNELLKKILNTIKTHCGILLSKNFDAQKNYLDNFVKIINIYLTNQKDAEHNAQIYSVALSNICEILSKSSDYLRFNEGLFVSKKQFLKFIDNFILKHKIYIPANPLEGVQILSLKEARNFPFVVVFVLGCSENNLPKAFSRSEILDDVIKQKLGLKTAQQLEKIDESSFCVICNSPCTVEISYSKTTNVNEITSKSKFIQILVSKYKIQEKEIHFKAKYFSSDISDFKYLQARTTIPEGLINKTFDDKVFKSFIYNISATHLENLIACPYKFLLSKLAITPFEIPGVKPDYKQEGLWLHEVLEKGLKNWPSSMQKDNILEFFITLMKENMPSTPTAKDTLVHMLYYGWPKFIEHILNLYANLDVSKFNPKKGLREFKIHDILQNNEYVLQYKNLILTPQGVIDSIDCIDNDVIVITDYKTSHIPTISKVKKGIYPQLIFYALCLAKHPQLEEKYKNLNKFILGYWNIKKAQWSIVACGSEALEILKQKFNKKASDINQIIDNMWDIVLWRTTTIIDTYKRFFADPSLCSFEQDYFCPFSGVCRKNDPSWYNIIHSQCLLKQRIDNDKRTT